MFVIELMNRRTKFVYAQKLVFSDNIKVVNIGVQFGLYQF
jgi:hypothetical protein